MKSYSSHRILIFLAALLLVMINLYPVEAENLSPQAVILVNTPLDEYNTSGVGTGCSLREAIQSANTNTAFGGCTTPGSGADTIQFSPNYTTYQISIGGTSGDDNHAGDLNIASSLTLQGNGESETIIDASYQSPRARAISVDDTQPLVDSTVTIQQLTVTGGYSQTLAGGGIYNHETLILENVTLSGNRSSRYGGGIYNLPYSNDSQYLSLTHCTLSGNQATLEGGAIANYGILNITDSLISNNEALSPGDETQTEGMGGGLYHVNGTLTIRNSIFTNNQATHSGGNFYLNTVSTSVVLIEDSTITNGTAIEVDGGNIFAIATAPSTLGVTLHNTEVSYGITNPGNGGGIYTNTHLTLENVTLSHNSANYGGGLYTATANSSVTIKNSTVTRNSQTVAGGGDGIYNATSGALGFRNSIFANNGYTGDPTGHGTDCGGSLASPPSQDYNLDRGDSCVFTPAEHDLTYTDPLLGSLLYNFGGNRTHALLPGSPAIDAGYDPTCMDDDQRGWYRPVDGDGNGTATCDIGAFEYGLDLFFLPLIEHLTLPIV